MKLILAPNNDILRVIDSYVAIDGGWLVTDVNGYKFIVQTVVADLVVVDGDVPLSGFVPRRYRWDGDSAIPNPDYVEPLPELPVAVTNFLKDIRQQGRLEVVQAVRQADTLGGITGAARARLVELGILVV
jgi:hypothetical protein